jgi:hypothetical protein
VAGNRPNSSVPMATHRCEVPAKEPGAKPSVRSVRFDREKDLIPGMDAIFEQNMAAARGVTDARANIAALKSKWRTFGALGGIKAAANRNGAPMQATHRCRTCSKTGTCKRSAILRPNRPNSCVPMATHRCVFPAKEPGAKPSVRSVRFDREKDLIPGMGAIFEQNLAHAQQRARVASPTDPPPPPLRVASPTDPPPPPPPQ